MGAGESQTKGGVGWGGVGWGGGGQQREPHRATSGRQGQVYRVAGIHVLSKRLLL